VTTWYNRAFPAGTIVRGKWNEHTYRIERLIGEGSNGVVFLVRRGRGLYALKAGFDAVDLQLEVNAIKTLRNEGPEEQRFLIDVDDYEHDSGTIPFYVMKWVKGRQMQQFISDKGADWIYPIGHRLLARLGELHEQGWVFGDLKPENVLVTGHGVVELIDYGGVTQKGKAVRQFTELYDRGYWNCGTRTADEGYDWFAFAVMCIKACDPNGQLNEVGALLPQNRTADVLYEAIRQSPTCMRLKPFLDQAIQGGFVTPEEAIKAWKACVYSRSHSRSWSSRSTARGTWIQVAFAASLVICLMTTAYYWLS
jgi:serine/threonine protein kinase